MAKIIVVTSGKGGVGKTTTSANFATGLALHRHRTVVIDFDVGLRNLDLIMGCERRVVYDLVNVIHDEAKLSQALLAALFGNSPFLSRCLLAETGTFVELLTQDVDSVFNNVVISVTPKALENLDEAGLMAALRRARRQVALIVALGVFLSGSAPAWANPASSGNSVPAMTMTMMPGMTMALVPTLANCSMTTGAVCISSR